MLTAQQGVALQKGDSKGDWGCCPNKRTGKAHRFGNVKKCAVEKRPKTYGSTEMHPFFGVERSGTEQNGCGAPRGGQAAGCVFFFAHSLYAAGGNPPGLTVVILTRL